MRHLAIFRCHATCVGLNCHLLSSHPSVSLNDSDQLSSFPDVLKKAAQERLLAEKAERQKAAAAAAAAAEAAAGQARSKEEALRRRVDEERTRREDAEVRGCTGALWVHGGCTVGAWVHGCIGRAVWLLHSFAGLSMQMSSEE